MKRTQKTLMIFFLAVSSYGCSQPVPKVNVKFWAGDSKNDAITRAQDPDQIKCNDVRFDNYACLSYEDIRSLFDALQGSCQQFDSAKLMTVSEKRRFYAKNKPVIDSVLKQQ